MVLEKLGSSLKNTIEKIARSVFVDEKLINELVKDIQKALLSSDVNVRLVFELTKKIKERILKEDTPPGLSKKEHLVHIVYEELTNFMGGEQKQLDLTKKPFKIMMVGLFGAGKTTTTGKLAKYFSNRGKKVALVGLDVHRPGAMDQIEQISKKANVVCFVEPTNKDAVKFYNNIKSQLDNFDIVIIDTAGRDALNEDLIDEIEALDKAIAPDQNFLVISADIGQSAQRQAQQFHDSVGVTGVIITKMDGTAKAGGALSACAVTDAPIKFIGVGEKIDDLEHFNAKGFVGRLLGMGDIEALLDKAKLAINEEDAEDMGKRFLKGEFNLIDLYEQMQALNKMGPISKVMEMIPGMSQIKLPKEALNVQQGKLKKWKFLMQSCTKEELEEPDSIDRSRIERIAKGSGSSITDVRELLKQYKQAKKMMKMFKGKDPQKMMKKFGGMKGMSNLGKM